MNILYVSNLNDLNYSGLTYSVPAQITAQSKKDNVFWYNVKDKGHKNWKKLDFYNDLNNYPKGKIKKLPVPFNKPDLIIVEGFYSIIRSKIFFEIFMSNIPYIIIPRGELTKKAQERKKLKKSIANLLLCNVYAKKALAIEYLTEQEKEDAEKKWNDKTIVIPNGVSMLKKDKDKIFSKNKIICSFIGRIEPYQKGIDLLIEACKLKKKELIENNVIINIYGPDEEGKLKNLQEIVKISDLQTVLKFYNGIYEEEKRNVLLNTDIFIMTSRFEGHPMALIEALSYGIPVLITKGTNMKKEIDEFDAGWTAENNVESIANSLLNMIKEKSTLQKKSKNAQKVAELYEWNNIAQKSHELYNKLLKNRGKE